MQKWNEIVKEEIIRKYGDYVVEILDSSSVYPIYFGSVKDCWYWVINNIFNGLPVDRNGVKLDSIASITTRIESSKGKTVGLFGKEKGTGRYITVEIAMNKTWKRGMTQKQLDQNMNKFKKANLSQFQSLYQYI